MGMLMVRPVVPVTPLALAEIVAVPEATPLTKPLAETVAIAAAEEAQLAVAVRSAVEPSV
jgi:hypothetical protein